MVKPRNLSALLALGALTALPACSMFGGDHGSSQAANNPPPPPVASSSTADNGMNGSTNMASNGNMNSNNMNNGSGSDQGMQGNASHGTVRRVQAKLKENNEYAGRVDGMWGPMTEHGVRDWQQSHSLQVTGQLDRATLRSMDVRGGGQMGMGSSGGNENYGAAGNQNGNTMPANATNSSQTGQTGANNGNTGGVPNAGATPAEPNASATGVMSGNGSKQQQ
jgi:peptidoglycan hydrolase-like protein with peptidoglycan-binding domain